MDGYKGDVGVKTQPSSVGLAGNARSMSASATMSGLISDHIRRQIAGYETAAPCKVDDVTTKSESALPDLLQAAVLVVQEIMENDIDRQQLDERLADLFERQASLYYKLPISNEHRKKQYISRHGLVMSPDQCITTQLDSLRVRAYIRGIHAALTNLASRVTGPIHIVYPACGPFAPLLLPLLAYYHNEHLYTPDELRVTLIDMQPGAILALRALLAEQNLEDYIHAVVCQDAVDYQPDMPVHLVVLEAMQHGFSREGHLVIARHFARIMEPDGEFIPHKVTVRAVLNVGQREYVDQWKDVAGCSEGEMNQQIKDERTDLGEILEVTPASLRKMEMELLDEFTSLVKCGCVQVPELSRDHDKQLLLICSEVQTYELERVGEYDSGITHPLPDEQVCINFQPHSHRPGDLLVKSGDRLRFYYCINGLPGFMATIESHVDKSREVDSQKVDSQEGGYE
ncbi:hypothetical protein BTA51_23635 [Hahella sp. CCB-MM4]|uniref:hypothetical protein n=1 Tax=Hahella sp. (strain CCB-MM4) TaxID=1926491 RepID=UPI000B9C75F4|nr:hypothetical protein [Hahella sp. CCB-MM4]OZG70834.1 hypothetical protein BTA51_23635 [Hahella sp. CCB-MM4]